ncbi:ribosomal biogenesis GTPase [Synergistales bacterium]|nr:ribosomal biogenesis GTPase [Synergistales bacterium]
MEVRFVTRGTEIDAGLKSYMEGKISKLAKFFNKIPNAQVIVTLNKGTYNVETTANANGVVLRAEERSQEPRRAFDQALKGLERQIKRHNSYLKDKSQFSGGEDFSFSEGGPAAAEDGFGFDSGNDPVIEKVKKVPLYPMTEREAVMQMELVGHNFFLFQNGDTGDVNLVYKRKDGGYGHIIPVR